MKQISAYLHFSGNCRDAMTFYHHCLGGELMLLPINESPMAGDYPAQMHDRILHSDLKVNGFTLMGDDLGTEQGAVANQMSLIVECSSEAEITALFAKLATGGKVLHSLEDTFWNSIFGDLTDQFGFHWYLNCDKNTSI